MVKAKHEFKLLLHIIKILNYKIIRGITKVACKHKTIGLQLKEPVNRYFVSGAQFPDVFKANGFLPSYPAVCTISTYIKHACYFICKR